MVLRAGLSSLLHLVYPERCVLCGADPVDVPWTGKGCRVRGLRRWDRTQLCHDCLTVIRGTGPVGRPPSPGVSPVWAAVSTSRSLVTTVGALKYHGVRGLGWPLAALMAGALPRQVPRPTLVPIPLHRRRRRERGFNQAGLLARLVARETGVPYRGDLLVRRRATAQQARITGDEERQANLAGAFRAIGPEKDPAGRPLLLVDDLVTSGATATAAAAELAASGWLVVGVLALGLATGDRDPAGPVDTTRVGF